MIRNRDQRVLIITSVHHWDDIRIYKKQALSIKKYFSIKLLATGLDVDERALMWVTINPPPSSRLARAKAHIGIWNHIYNVRPDLIHFHDPDLLFLGLLFKLFFGIHVIYDIHEDYGKYIKTKNWIPLGLRRVIATVFDKFERLMIPTYSGAIAGSPQIYRRIGSSKNVHIGNVPEIYSTVRMRNVIVRETIRMVYAGTIENIRGVVQLCEFVLMHNEEYENSIDLIIAGSAHGLTEEQRKKFDQYCNEPGIQYMGFLSTTDLNELLDKCNIGVIPFQNNCSNESILPHKLFDYMNAGLPVLAGEGKGWPQLVTAWNVGLQYDPNDYTSFKGAIAQWRENSKLLGQMGRTGQDLVHSKYNWENHEAKLIAYYQSILGT